MQTGQSVLVTGGGGFLGGAIVRQLVEMGATVRSFSRRKYPHLDRLGVEQHQGDLSDARAVENACRDVETVFHTAAKAGVWGACADYYRANVLGTRHVLAACRAMGVARLIHTSSPSVVFASGDMEGVDESVPYPSVYHAHYPRTKAVAEQEVRAAARQGLPAIILRPHLIWGPGDPHIAPRLIARAHRLRRIGTGRNKVDTIYIDNAATAHLLADQALKNNPTLSGKVYFISQGEPIALWQMIDRILQAGGKPPLQKSISPAAAVALGAVCEGIYTFFRLKGEPPMTRFVAREMSTAHWFNIEAARRDLGYAPRVSIDQGMENLARWLRNQPSLR